MRNKIYNLFKDKNVYMITLMILLFFGIFVKMDFATDTYNVFMNLNNEIITHFASCGRFITAVILLIVYKLNISNETTYIASYGLAILAMVISVYKLSKLINKEIKSNSISLILSILILVNIFSIELFMYLEKGIIVASILFSIIALENLVKYFETKNKLQLLWTAISMLIAVTCYQGTVAIFVAISLIYICKYSEKIKEFIINNIITALCYGIAAGINLIVTRMFFVNQRVSGAIIIKESIIKVLAGTKNMLIETYSIFPKYLYLISIIFVGILIIVFAIWKEKSINKIAKHIFYTIYVIVGILVATVLPQIMQNTDSIWFVARSTYAGASIFGILLLYVFINFDFNKYIKNIIIICIVIFMVIQLKYFYRIEIDHYILNYNDKILAKQIGTMIDEYEEENGIKVNKICIYEDSSISYTYPEIFCSGDINITAFYPNWSKVELIEYYTGRRFEIVEKNKEIEEGFLKENWNYFSEKQIIFENNIIHLCVF